MAAGFFVGIASAGHATTHQLFGSSWLIISYSQISPLPIPYDALQMVGFCSLRPFLISENGKSLITINPEMAKPSPTEPVLTSEDAPFLADGQSFSVVSVEVG